jgi:hypothetical protein
MQTGTNNLLTFIDEKELIMKKGDVVYSSGLGKTNTWNQTRGIISKVSHGKIYVKWDNTSFEDEMEYHEVLKFDPNQLLRFSDGVEIFTGGPYRIIQEIDGFYVTGRGKLIPVKNRDKGEKIIDQIKEKDRVTQEKLFNTSPDHVHVSLDELIQLNNISISNKYNRSLDKDFNLFLHYDSKFVLRPLLTHHHRRGVECEPHVRYLVTQVYPTRELQLVLDLPVGEIRDMLG